MAVDKVNQMNSLSPGFNHYFQINKLKKCKYYLLQGHLLLMVWKRLPLVYTSTRSTDYILHSISDIYFLSHT